METPCVVIMRNENDGRDDVNNVGYLHSMLNFSRAISQVEWY